MENFWGGFIGAFIGGYLFVCSIVLVDAVIRRVEKYRRAKAAAK